MAVSRKVSRFLQGALAVAALVAAGGLGVMRADARQPQAAAIEVMAKRFAFVPDRIEVVEGDSVTLAVKSADGTHGIEIKKLKIKKEVPRGGVAVLVSFTAPAAGAYQISCSEYCGRGHEDMRATLVVKARSL
jgi:cytochrome c oxidase subunit 2